MSFDTPEIVERRKNIKEIERLMAELPEWVQHGLAQRLSNEARRRSERRQNARQWGIDFVKQVEALEAVEANRELADL